MAVGRAPWLAGAGLGVLALAELAGRLAFQAGEPDRLGVTTPRVAGLNVPTVLLVVLLCALTTVPLAVPRPDAAALLIGVGAVLSLAVFGLLTVAGAAAVLIAGYLTGRDGAASLAGVLGVPFVVLALVRSGAADVRVIAVLLAFLTPAAGLAGAAQRARGSAQLLGAAREVTAGSLAEHLARGERARIARELHDVVAHHISMIAVQAETARLTTPGLPSAGARRFAEIGSTARAGLTEMRRLLGILREDVSAAAPAARNPQPGLTELNQLLDEAREASGAGVRLIVSGPVARLDQGIELAAYRIVQEALTNARRHAPGAAVDVELRYQPDTLRLRVRDNGPGSVTGVGVGAAGGGGAPDGLGHGLVGMRERAQAAGGSLTAGSVPGGGFMVEATLPAAAASQAA